MSLTLTPQAPPLRIDQRDTIRVGNTRVTLEILIHAFWDGATPEQIVEDFDSLTLADVYAVIAYYLQHKAEVDAYVDHRDKLGAAAEQGSRKRNADLGDVRARLLARRDKSQ
jgi:uncharacterized protein (DUF433 family)